MPGIEEDIQRTEALGFVHTGFRGGAIEYQNYTCPRTGLVLCIPLGNGPYIVQRPHPDYTELGRTPLIEDAFALIAQQPADPDVHIANLLTPQEQAEHVAMRVRAAAELPSRPVFPPLPPRPRREKASAKGQRQASPPGGSGNVSGRGAGRGPRASRSSAEASAEASEEDPPWLRWGLLAAFGIPGLLLLVWLVVSELLPLLILPAMYLMGLGEWAVLLTGAVAGVTWGAAASTWLGARNAGAVLGGAAIGALSAWLLASPDDLLGSAIPVYAAMAVSSLVSAVLENPRIHLGRMAVFAVAAGLFGAVLAARTVETAPLPALWLTAVAAHGVIAVASRRIWKGVLDADPRGAGGA